ncbi:MAG: tetratricopeptide repeat protein [Cyanobacteria bacterium J06648_16]
MIRFRHLLLIAGLSLAIAPFGLAAPPISLENPALPLPAASITAAFEQLDLGIEHEDAGRYSAALRAYERAAIGFRRADAPEGETYAIGNIGNVYRWLGNYQAAYDYRQRALERFSAQSESEDEATAWAKIFLADVYLSLHDYPQAVDYYQSSFDTLEQVDQAPTYLRRTGQSHAALGIGLSYALQDQPLRAAEHYWQALTYLELAYELESEALQDEAVDAEVDIYYLSEILTALGATYIEQGDIQRGIALHQRALAHARAFGYTEREAQILTNLGVAQATLSNAAAAVEYYQQALTLYEQMGSREGWRQTLVHLTQAYIELGQHERAIATLTQANTLAEEIQQMTVNLPPDLRAAYAESLTEQARLGAELGLSPSYAESERTRL